MSNTTHRLTGLMPFAACVLLIAGGCSTLSLPSASPFGAADTETNLVGSVDPMSASGTSSQSVYMKVREARAQNSIVLQVASEGEPLRVLPLPSDGRTVFVTTLLQQAGVQKKLGTMDATLFRYSKEAVGGIPMEVRMNQEKTTVRPESDYALQAGDRLMVRKVDFVALKSLLNSTLGI